MQWKVNDKAVVQISMLVRNKQNWSNYEFISEQALEIFQTSDVSVSDPQMKTKAFF